jgi:hypothetical protein
MCLQHAGIHSVINPGEAVFMESGENLVQWRKLFFCQYGVSMQHATFSMCLTTNISPLEIMPKLTSICLHLQSLSPDLCSGREVCPASVTSTKQFCAAGEGAR